MPVLFDQNDTAVTASLYSPQSVPLRIIPTFTLIGLSAPSGVAQRTLIEANEPLRDIPQIPELSTDPEHTTAVPSMHSTRKLVWIGVRWPLCVAVILMYEPRRAE